MCNNNHGPATSIYYADPDGNSVEMSATNFLEETDYLAFMKSETYARNVSGIEIDPAYVDTVVRRWQTFTGQSAALSGRTFSELEQEASHVENQ